MEGCWGLFWATGSPVFYLLYRREAEEASEAKTAWKATPAAEV